MKNKLAKISLIAILILTSSFIIVEAKSSKKKYVWWTKNAPESNGGGTWKAQIMETKKGVIHEWRYEWNSAPVKTHIKYKPVALYPDQPGDKWFRWTFDDRYGDLPGDEADLVDYFTRYTEYWVTFNRAVY